MIKISCTDCFLLKQRFSEAEGAAHTSVSICEYSGLLPPLIWQKSGAQEATCKLLALRPYPWSLLVCSDVPQVQ